MPETNSRVTLVLEGERARVGVSLAAFEGFVKHFITALRYHHRATRATPIRKTGRPFTTDDMATAFRLVEFRTGSGIAVLEPPLDAEGETAGRLADVPTLAWENLADLLDTVERMDTLQEAVADELEAATKALGSEGRFSVEFKNPSRVRKYVFDHNAIERLRPKGAAEPLSKPLTISGLLHAIDLEPDKVAIRTASGIDWTCRYPAELEPDVMQLIGKLVWARGVGRATSSRTGVFEVAEIHAVPEYEQTSLFTGAPLPLAELMRRQGVRKPQGLAAFADPEWEDDEGSALFLEALLDEAE